MAAEHLVRITAAVLAHTVGRMDAVLNDPTARLSAASTGGYHVWTRGLSAATLTLAAAGLSPDDWHRQVVDTFGWRWAYDRAVPHVAAELAERWDTLARILVAGRAA